jgi:hypothetical protein
MGNFFIKLSENIFESEGDSVSLGSLKIGSFEEEFYASQSYWNRKQYISQWQEALERLLKGKDKTAIITSIYDPKTANFLFWWVIYLIGNNVHVQNHVLFLEDLDERFDENEPYKFIPEREIQTEEGEQISEWIIDIEDIIDFLRPQ